MELPAVDHNDDDCNDHDRYDNDCNHNYANCSLPGLEVQVPILGQGRRLPLEQGIYAEKLCAIVQSLQLRGKRRGFGCARKTVRVHPKPCCVLALEALQSQNA